MLIVTKSFCSFSVDNLDKAHEFYTKILGLTVDRTPEGLAMKAPNDDVFIYPKPNHQPATFTVMNFVVFDVEAAVDGLTQQGIKFHQYTGEIQTDGKGISRGNGPTIAWFNDPAGNILSVVQQKN